MQIKSKILEKINLLCVYLVGLVCGVVLTDINKTVPFLKLSHYHIKKRVEWYMLYKK